MAEEITRTIENVDRLFSEIIVNGESHVSQRFNSPSPQSSTPSVQAQAQGEDVHAVDLNNVLHNFSDPEMDAVVQDIRDGLAGEVSARSLADQALSSDIAIEANARQSADNLLQGSITAIESKIPAQASAQNQLADKNFVNSSIATNTANFLGTYTSMADIEAIQNPTNNDYVFLQTTDSAGNRQYDRYKYSSSDNQWHYEYTLNNSSFTAEQWATINSGLTQSSVNQAIATACAYCASSNTTVTGASLYTGATLKVLFTAQIAGADTSSALIITYNGTPYAVKTAKDGSLIDFTAKASGNDFVYCQAYTTLELMFDGTNFIIIGNPVVISNSDYTVYADGRKNINENRKRVFSRNSFTLGAGEKVKILEKIANYGDYFNIIFSWASYGSGNYLALYLLRLTNTSITTKQVIYEVSNIHGVFSIENGDLYFMPNDGYSLTAGGASYSLILS